MGPAAPIKKQIRDRELFLQILKQARARCSLIHPCPSRVEVYNTISVCSNFKMATMLGHTESTEYWLVSDCPTYTDAEIARTPNYDAEMWAYIDDEIPLSQLQARLQARALAHQAIRLDHGY